MSTDYTAKPVAGEGSPTPPEGKDYRTLILVCAISATASLELMWWAFRTIGG